MDNGFSYPPESPTEPAVSVSPGPGPSPADRPRVRVLVPLLLLLLTVVTTVFCGFELYVSFSIDDPQDVQRLPSLTENPALLLYGVPFSVTLLAILLAHEMGHYLTCRHYRIRATLPFVIPAPPLLPIPPPLSWLLGAGSLLSWSFIPFNPFGTFGAVIRIKSLFANRRQLFDVGIAGPLAGFVVILPALVGGVVLSREFVLPDSESLALEFGEPLIFRLAVALFYTAGDGSNITLHPIGMAAWFGMLATSLNLLPIGQLDGGHIVYALFGARTHRRVSCLTFVGLIALSLYSWPTLAYLFFALVLLFLGFRHPRPYQDWESVGRGRWVIALIGLIVFSLTFIPVPIQIVEHTVRL